MSLYYTDEDGASVCVLDFFPEENIYEEKNILLYVYIKFDEDSEELLHVEKNLLEKTSKLNLDYVGWKLNDGWLEFYYYAEQAKGFENALNEALKPKYQFESGNTKDKKHDAYYKMLLPNDGESHIIQSEEIISELEDSGDDLSLEHRIEYHVMFETSSQRKRFIDKIEEINFNLLQEFLDEKAEDDFVYGVVLTRLSAVNLDILKEHTHDLFPIINEEHGRYEGWGTEALTDTTE